MSKGEAGVPRVVRGLLRVGLARDAAERALGDLTELCQRIAEVRGPGAARGACVRECGFILLWSAFDRIRRAFERRQSRVSRKPIMMRELGRDFRHGARALRRSPGFTTVGLLTLALGIGANTAIFSVVDRVLLHPAPWPEPERVVVIGWEWRVGSERTWGLSPVKAQFWKDNSRWFSAFAIVDGTQFVLTGAGEPQQVSGERVSDGYFGVIGMRPLLGRAFHADEDRPGTAPVVILTDGFWQRSFGGDRGIVGRQIMLDRVAHTVIGVMPPHFRGAEGDAADVLAPLRLEVDPRSQGHNYFAFGRLAANVSRTRLASEVAAFTGRFDRAYPGVVEQGSFWFIAYNEYVVGDFLRTAVWILFAAVAVVLLIACANVTSLLLGRADARRRELAVRAALGAGRSRLAGHLITESLLLALLGGGLGLLFARWGLYAILALAPAGVPGLDRVELSVPVLGFALVVSVLTGILVGLGGAAPVLRQDLVSILKEGGRAQTASARRLHARGLLIMTETAFAVVLLVGAALLLVSFFRLRAVELGFEPEGVYTIELRLPADRYSTTEATWQFDRQVLERLRALPGVGAAGSTANLPLVRGLNTGATVLSPGEQQHDIVEFRAVSPEFLDILGVRLLYGRDFTEADHAGAPRVALVNEAFARRFFPDAKPLGATIRVGGEERTVIGVVHDIKDMGLRQDARATVFAPRSQTSDGATRAMNEWFIAAFAIRAENATALAPALRRAVQEVDPEQPILRMRPMTDVVTASIANEQFNTRLLATFGALALVLTAIGVYGVVSYSVGRRTHEIGLRMALGARRSGVVGLVVRQGMVMVVIGVALGLVAAYALSRLLSGLLFGVRPTDPGTFAAVALLIAAVALLASYIPARRASRVDPLTALRAE